MTRFVASLLVVGLLATACGAGAGESADAVPGGAGEGVTAVATAFPLAWIATQVAPGSRIEFLGSRGQDPHDLELSPGDREVLETADILLHMGDLDFQPQVEEAATAAGGTVVDAAAVAGRARLLGVDDGHDDDGHDDDGHDDDGHNDDAHNDDGHDDEAFDPHLWFDGRVMADVAEETGARFAAVDPARAATFERNAAAVAERLRAVEDEIDTLLVDCRHDTAIVSHEAYAYLLRPRGLHQEGISGTGGHAPASPQRLADLTERIDEQGVDAVAAEPIEGRPDAEALANEAGVDLVEIHPLEVVTDEQFAVGYPDLLRAQAEAFAAVLDCG